MIEAIEIKNRVKRIDQNPLWTIKKLEHDCIDSEFLHDKSWGHLMKRLKKESKLQKRASSHLKRLKKRKNKEILKNA